MAHHSTSSSNIDDDEWVTVQDSTTEELVSIKPSLKPYILQGITNNVQVLLQVHTNSREHTKERPPMNMCVVLDVSGSMSGEKITNCILAVKHVIRQLNVKDKLHFVTYSNDATVVFENGDLDNKEGLEQIVDRNVKAAGNTNLESGLQLGFSTLQKHMSPTAPSNRIFVFSDGQVNRGITDSVALCDLVKGYQSKGVNTTSFGIGEDFNEVVMKGLAEHGKGLYFFIDTAESVVRLVNKAFDGILKLIGTHGILKVRGEKGTVVKRVYGHPDLLRGMQREIAATNNNKETTAME